MTCAVPGNSCIRLSRLAMGLRYLVIILPSLMLILLYYIDIHICNCIYWNTILWGHIPEYPLTLLLLLQFQIHLAYKISWITPFRRVTIRNPHRSFYTELRAFNASAKCLDMSIELSGMGTGNFVWILEAIWPETGRDTKEWGIIHTWDSQFRFGSRGKSAGDTSRPPRMINRPDLTLPDCRSNDAW